MTKSYRLKTPKPQNAREAAYAAGNQNAREAVDRQRAEIMTAVMPASPAERICNDESKLLASFEVGDVSHQGDIIIVRIASLPRSARPRSNRQLAEGTTQGSRHVLTRGDVYDANVREVASLLKDATRVDVETRYVGPVFVSPADPTADDLTHPEHGNQGFPAGAVCAVVFQRNLDAEQREARVAD
jgi:hypothetical protein